MQKDDSNAAYLIVS